MVKFFASIEVSNVVNFDQIKQVFDHDKVSVRLKPKLATFCSMLLTCQIDIHVFIGTN